LPTIHRQLLRWCRVRGFEDAEDFARRLDDRLAPELVVTAETLLKACRTLTGTRFFAENRLDRDEVANELASWLEIPAPQIDLVKATPEAPDKTQPVAADDAAPDLFLSYFHEDTDFVIRLANAVARRGFLVWYDRIGLTAGISFPHIIERALELANYVGIVATAKSIERPWVRREIDATYVRENEEAREILIPLRLDDSKLPLFLRTKQWCNFRESFEQGLEELIATLSR
jgi:hypothetical protein